MTQFDKQYIALLRNILQHGSREPNARTKHETAALPGMFFATDIEKDGFPLLTLRKIPINLFIAEQIWFLSGARRPEDFLQSFTKIWDNFTNPGNVVTAAYGYRWRHFFDRDQIKELIKLLQDDPSSRHGVVITWDPASDGLGGVPRKNIPCPYSFTVMIIGGRLHLMNVVRSNDMMLGFPHDVAGFALLQCILAQALGVRPGIYSHSIANAHIYDIHYMAAEQLCSRPTNHKKVTLHLPPHSLSRAEQRDHELVAEIAQPLKDQYNPGSPIKGLEIVL